MKASKLSVTLHIGGTQIDKLTPEQCKRVVENLSKAMSDYYTTHPDEFSKI